MFKVVEKRNWFFALSLLVIIPGLISLILWGLHLGADFTGGTLLEIKFKTNVEKNNIIEVGSAQKLTITLQPTAQNTYILRSEPLEDKQVKGLTDALNKKFSGLEILRKETIGPTIGKELFSKSLTALAIASLMIVIYIAWAFRSVPKPASSWRFGITAIITLLHDVLVLVGVFSLLGHFLNVEVDALFVTAVLTVIGFSVHDTIVVFDRIRENLNKASFKTFDETVDHSIMQTIGRSLNTSMTVLLVLAALLLFGGSSIRWFVVALLVGIISGTYSSIFNAAPILVVWQNWSDKRSSVKKKH